MNTSNIGNYSPEFRLASEARHVLKYNKEQRTAYYEKVLPLRGQKAVNELVAEVNRQRKLAQEQSAEMEM